MKYIYVATCTVTVRHEGSSETSVVGVSYDSELLVVACNQEEEEEAPPLVFVRMSAYFTTDVVQEEILHACGEDIDHETYVEYRIYRTCPLGVVK